MNIRKVLIILAHALVGWALCGASMWIGMAVTTEQNALVIHAVGAPIFFGLVSLVYFRRFDFTSPLATAAIFVSFVIAMDFFLVALVINKSLEMFESLLGTWIPFLLLSTSTYLTGQYVTRSPQLDAAVQ